MYVINQDQVYKYFHDNAKQLADVYLPPDRQKKGWICPICGNGSGEDGDGLRINPNAKEPGHFHCFVCGFDGDLIDLIGKENKMLDDAEMLKKACEIFGIELKNPEKEIKLLKSKTQDSYETSKDQGLSRREKVLSALQESLEGKPGKFSQLLKLSHSILPGSPAAKYIKERGITENNPFLKYMGYLKNTYVGNRSFKGGIAFFSSNASYSVRDIFPIPPESNLKKTMKPAGSIDIPVGLLDVIKAKNKKMAENNSLEPVFICEGLFDALSIAEAGADAIALNGTNNILPIIWAFQEYGIERPLLLSLDNDAGGEKALNKIKTELEKTDLAFFEAPFIPDDLNFKDANEFLLADRDFFEKQIKKYRKIHISEFEKQFNQHKKNKLVADLLRRGEHWGIKTGFDTLDSQNFLYGGLHPGLYIIGAISSLGKTTFALQMADQIAKSGQDVIFFSLEMPENEIMLKSISRYTLEKQIDSGELKPGEKPNYRAKSLDDLCRNYAQDPDGLMSEALNRYFEDTGKHLRIIEGMGNKNADDIADIVQEHIKITGNTPVVFIDYLQLLTIPRDRSYGMTDKQITDANVFRLKQISRDFEVSIFGISSFNRDNYREPVNMKSFKESGAIEYSSDVLIGLEPQYMKKKNSKERDLARKEYQKQEMEIGTRDIRLVVLKNRHGRAGGVDLFTYYPKYNCFLEQGEEQELDSRSKVVF